MKGCAKPSPPNVGAAPLGDPTTLLGVGRPDPHTGALVNENVRSRIPLGRDGTIRLEGVHTLAAADEVVDIDAARAELNRASCAKGRAADRTPFSALGYPVRGRDGVERWVVAVRARFDLRPDDRVAVAEARNG